MNSGCLLYMSGRAMGVASNLFCKALWNTIVCATVKVPQEGTLAADSGKAELADVIISQRR